MDFRKILSSDSSCTYEASTDGVIIGSVEGSISEDGALMTVVHVDKASQKMGFGYIMFEKVFNELNEKISVKTIVGSWHKDDEFSYCPGGMSSNLKLFLECMKGGENEYQCALRTPTGVWARRLGITKVEVISFCDTESTVIFTKPEK